MMAISRAELEQSRSRELHAALAHCRGVWPCLLYGFILPSKAPVIADVGRTWVRIRSSDHTACSPQKGHGHSCSPVLSNKSAAFVLPTHAASCSRPLPCARAQT